MKTYKKYTIFQSYKVVALKLSLPCPFECKNSKGRGTHNFWATTLKLWKNEYFLRVFKSYYYHFFIFLLDSDLEKTLLSQTSIAWGVLGQGHHCTDSVELFWDITMTEPTRRELRVYLETDLLSISTLKFCPLTHLIQHAFKFLGDR